VLAAQDGELVAEDHDLDLFGIRRAPAEHQQLEKAAQRQVDERPDRPAPPTGQQHTMAHHSLLITPPLNPRD
jgi:hypothetical protein